VPDPEAFQGVASGGRIDCKFDDLIDSYSRQSDSCRAVGTDRTNSKMVLYFYNG